LILRRPEDFTAYRQCSMKTFYDGHITTLFPKMELLPGPSEFLGQAVIL